MTTSEIRTPTKECVFLFCLEIAITIILCDWLSIPLDMALIAKDSQVLSLLLPPYWSEIAMFHFYFIRQGPYLWILAGVLLAVVA